jgi:hypothetical protein
VTIKNLKTNEYSGLEGEAYFELFNYYLEEQQKIGPIYPEKISCTSAKTSTYILSKTDC